MNRSVLYLALLVSINLGAQSPIKFSIQYNFGSTSGSGLSTSIFQINNDYVLAGIYTSSANVRGIGLVRTDSIGVIKYEFWTAEPHGSAYANNTASQIFIQLKNKNILFNGQYAVATDHTKACLVRLSHHTGDTIWTKSYSQPGDSCFLHSSTELNDSSIISLGFKYYINSPNIYSKPFMMRVDKNGNYKWHKYLQSTYNVNNLFYYMKIHRISDNDLLVGLVKQSSTTNGFITRMDTSCNILYSVPLTGLPNNSLNDLIPLSDGTYLCAGAYLPNSSKMQKFTYKFNGSNGVKITSKIYNEMANTNGIACLKERPDGIILAGGATGFTQPINTFDYVGDVLKLSSSLDSITTMYIDDGVLSNQKGVCNLLYSNADNGFATALQLFPASGQQKYWMVKADSNGCYTPVCQSLGLDTKLASMTEISVFPNPFNEKIILEVNDLSNLLNYGIYSSEGKLVLSGSFDKLSEKLEVNTAFLASGCYLIEIRSGDKIFHEKLVK